MEIKIENIQDVKKLLAGEHDSQNKVQVGYAGEKLEDTETRKVGDKWFDSDGNEWEQKNGYKVKLGKQWQQELQNLKQNRKQTPEIKAELTRLQKQLETLEINLESHLFSWTTLKRPFWQAVRFGGLGVIIGWLLKSWVG
jgi:uncharacterized protein (DUF3084 family)